MNDNFNLEVKGFDRDSFITLLEYMIHNITVKKVHFASHSELKGVDGGIGPYSRLDFTLTGIKHMIYPDGNVLYDVCMSPGEVCYSPPMTWKAPQWDHLHRMSSLVYSQRIIRITFIDYNQFSSRYLNQGADIFYHTGTPIPEAGKAILHALNLLSESPSVPEVANALVSVLLHLTLEVLKCGDVPKAGKHNLTFTRINQYLHENFIYPINRQHVASEFKLNPSYLSRLFSELGETTFNNTLRNMRLEHAAMLLKNSNLSVDEITNNCGYLSSTSFISTFKKQYGMPPGEFRKNSWKKK